MTININGDTISYTLEEEKTAGDVIVSLSSWLEGSGMLIGALDVNGKSRLLADSDWKNIPVESIETISVEALSLREGHIKQLETARDFFLLAETSITAHDEETFKELQESFNDLEHILPCLLREGPHPVWLPRLKEAFAAESGQPGSLKAAEAIHLATILDGRRREASHPEKEASSCAVALAGMAEHLDTVAVQLQTGRDKTAMETIIRLTEMLQAFMRAISWMDGVTKTEKDTSDMNGILFELEDALKAGDTVLIGDLLEYEIKPRLINLPEDFNLSRRSED